MLQDLREIDEDFLYPVYPEHPESEQIVFLHFLQYEQDYPAFEILYRKPTFEEGKMKVKDPESLEIFKDPDQQTLIYLERHDLNPNLFLAYYSTGPGWYNRSEFTKMIKMLERAEDIFNSELRNRFTYEAGHISD